MQPTILLTGGTGQTGTPITKLLLSKSNANVVVTSRKGSAGIPESIREFARLHSAADRLDGVQFDWDNHATWNTPFESGKTFDVVYLIPQYNEELVKENKAFIDIALKHGVRRIVLLSGAAIAIDAFGPGEIHRYLDDSRNQGKLKEYAVLRPSWFFTNFTRDYWSYIMERGELVSAARDGKLGWVHLNDIAEAAYAALLDPPENLYDEYAIMGPDLYSYDEAASLLTEVIGRKIVHRRLSQAEAVERWVELGVSEHFARAMVLIDEAVASGLEERVFKQEDTKGKDGKGLLRIWKGKRSLKDYLEENREVWKKQ
ncbi:hypothetical protein VNI00_010141 [Paramarasmius palmivorus]|uniref:NAD(P)-binding domain-containing protein n=1 Tax=Paramarasmius palmivorus TaxID=297713 RepID=A0AAW0CIZ3_9AGAR